MQLKCIKLISRKGDWSAICLEKTKKKRNEGTVIIIPTAQGPIEPTRNYYGPLKLRNNHSKSTTTKPNLSILYHFTLFFSVFWLKEGTMWTSHPSKQKNQNAALRQAPNKLDRVIVLRSKSIFFQTKNGSEFFFFFFWWIM